MHENAELLTLLPSPLFPLSLFPPRSVSFSLSADSDPLGRSCTLLCHRSPSCFRFFQSTSVSDSIFRGSDPTPPFNLHINPTRRNWRAFKRADLEFFRTRDAFSRRWYSFLNFLFGGLGLSSFSRHNEFRGYCSIFRNYTVLWEMVSFEIYNRSIITDFHIVFELLSLCI